MKFSRIVTSLIFCILFLIGCYRDYSVYGFKSEENNFSWGFVGAKLIGSEKLVRNTVIKSSPYELFIWFGSDTNNEGVIQILDLKLVNAKTKKVVLAQSNNTKKPIKKYEANYRAYFSFKNIEIVEYAELSLQIKFLFNQDNKSTEYNTEIYFGKDYKKFRRILGV